MLGANRPPPLPAPRVLLAIGSALTTLLAVTLAPPAWATPAGGARIAIVTIEDEAQVGDAIRDEIELALRGAALEADLHPVRVTLTGGAREGDACGPGCLAELAAATGCELVLRGAVRSDEAGYALYLALYDVHAVEAGGSAPIAPIDERLAPARDAGELVGLAWAHGAMSFAAAHAWLSAEGGEGDEEWGAEEGEAMAPAAWIRGYRPPKSMGAAVGLELLAPGFGLIYAEEWGPLGVQVAGIAVGILLLLAGHRHAEEVDSAMVLGGALVIVGARVYGVGMAARGVRRHNARALERFRASGGLVLPLPREASVGLAGPPARTLSLTSVSF